MRTYVVHHSVLFVRIGILAHVLVLYYLLFPFKIFSSTLFLLSPSKIICLGFNFKVFILVHIP